MKKIRSILPVLALLFVVAVLFALPRLARLDQFVTTDEPLWLTRSANFYYALGQRDFAATFQREHPGVTVMWAGTAGFLWQFPTYRGTGIGQIEPAKHEKVFQALNKDPLDLMVAGRVFVVLAVSVVLAAAIGYVRVLWGMPAAVFSAVLLAFDPFLTGMTRLLHLDGLLAALMFLSLLAYLAFLLRGNWLHLLVSGVAAGLSWLTKSPGLFLAPFLFFLAVFHLYWTRRVPDEKAPRFWSNLAGLAVWAGVGGGVFFALWPSMWVNPLDTLQKIFSMAEMYASEGHGSASFFLGQVFYSGERPWVTYLYYPISTLWRITPAALVGLLFLPWVFVRRITPLDTSARRFTAVGLVLFSLLFVVFMTIGDKLADRYVLPVFPTLDILAAAGWLGVLYWLHARIGRTQLARWLPGVLLGFVVLLQAAVFWPVFPYYLNYYNPLVGGIFTAQKVVPIGWGEGLDQAGRYLSAKPNATDLEVASWYNTGSFSYFFPGETRSIPALPDVSPDSLTDILASDYVVIYIHQWQRQAPTSLLAQLKDLEPVAAIRLSSLDYVEIYQPVPAQETSVP
jgi:hypothetical protein